MSSLQISLGIVGVLLIGAIIGHGLWTMRKNNQKIKQQSRTVAEKRAASKQQGFDDDGIGSVRVVKRNTEQNKPPASEPASEETAPVQPKSAADDGVAEQMSMNLDLDESTDTPLPSMRVDKDEESPLQQAEMSLDDDQPASEEDTETVETDEVAAEEPVAASPDAQPEPQNTPEQPPEEVISLFVKGNVQGAVLLQMMTELGCKFGEMGIFHRYEQTSGNGPMIFSVANMFNPGTFDLDNIENFETDGVALFMTLPLNYDGQQAFNMMLNAAKKLAMEIPQGQVLDGERQLLSRQSIQQAHQRIREFEKQSL